jgi:hypothetical protein
MGRGEISPDEAAIISSVLESRRRAIETDELARRIAALEERGMQGTAPNQMISGGPEHGSS